MQTLSKLVSIFNKKQKIQFIGLFCILFLGSIMELCSVSVILPMAQGIMDADSLMKNKTIEKIMRYFGLDGARQLLTALIVFMILVFAIKNIYLVFMTYIKYQILWHNQLEMETGIMSILIKKPYLFHTKKNTAELQRTILTDIGNVFFVMDNIFLLVSECITCGLLVMLLFATNSRITLVTSVFLGGGVLIYFLIFRKRLYWYGKLTQLYGWESVKCVNQAFEGIKEIKIYQSEPFFVDEFKSYRSKQINMMKRGKFFQNAPKYFLETICITGVLIPILLQVRTGKDERELVAQLAVFAMAAFKLLPSINQINSQVSCIVGNKASVDLIYETKKDITEDGEEAGKRKKEEQTGDDSGCITLKDVSFRYNDRERWILRNIAMSVKLGSAVALVGPSGAGKTTMADLILGIIEPTSGTIEYRGRDIAGDRELWCSKIGYIPQNIYLCDDTIRKNVAFGQREIDDKKVWKALTEAQLADFVMESENKLDTVIGERGICLSGGQRQRIGIARALYHNPEILVLDEATSALDSETESAIMESIDNLKGKKTLIIIAHRLTTIRNCDQVYRVDNGTVALE